MKIEIVVLFCLIATVQVLTGARPPSIVLQGDKDIYFKVGESVEIPCVAEGYPTPNYTWHRNAEDFNPSSDEDRVIQQPGVGTLVFSRTEPRDEGVFQCFATNAHGQSISDYMHLREAKLKDFPAGDTIFARPELGKSLTLSCIPPESVPRPDVFWGITKNKGGFEPINYDARVTMDHEYRLRFTNVQASDHRNGSAYACMVENKIVGKSTLGPRYIVMPQGRTPEFRPVEYLWATPEDNFALRGRNFRAKCIFSGNPTPDVHWERTEGESLPGRAQIRSFGQELMIEDIQLVDAGTYQCWATNINTATRVQRTISVRVESSPYWVVEPTDVEVEVGGTAEFECFANGYPEPQYYWSINGVRLHSVVDERILSGRFKRPSPNRVVFSNLTLEDAMVIQCNATNKHGFIWRDVCLDVYEAPTSIGMMWKPGPVLAFFVFKILVLIFT